MLVCFCSVRRAFGCARYSETRFPGATKVVGFPLDKLTENLSKRYVSPSRLALEQRQIVAVSR